MDRQTAAMENAETVGPPSKRHLHRPPTFNGGRNLRYVKLRRRTEGREKREGVLLGSLSDQNFYLFEQLDRWVPEQLRSSEWSLEEEVSLGQELLAMGAEVDSPVPEDSYHVLLPCMWDLRTDKRYEAELFSLSHMWRMAPWGELLRLAMQKQHCVQRVHVCRGDALLSWILSALKESELCATDADRQKIMAHSLVTQEPLGLEDAEELAMRCQWRGLHQVQLWSVKRQCEVCLRSSDLHPVFKSTGGLGNNLQFWCPTVETAEQNCTMYRVTLVVPADQELLADALVDHLFRQQVAWELQAQGGVECDKKQVKSGLVQIQVTMTGKDKSGKSPRDVVTLLLRMLLLHPLWKYVLQQRTQGAWELMEVSRNVQALMVDSFDRNTNNPHRQLLNWPMFFLPDGMKPPLDFESLREQLSKLTEVSSSGCPVVQPLHDLQHSTLNTRYTGAPKLTVHQSRCLMRCMYLFSFGAHLLSEEQQKALRHVLFVFLLHGRYARFLGNYRKSAQFVGMAGCPRDNYSDVNMQDLYAVEKLPLESAHRIVNPLLQRPKRRGSGLVRKRRRDGTRQIRHMAQLRRMQQPNDDCDSSDEWEEVLVPMLPA